jgi:hypothetical protein
MLNLFQHPTKQAHLCGCQPSTSLLSKWDADMHRHDGAVKKYYKLEAGMVTNLVSLLFNTFYVVAGAGVYFYFVALVYKKRNLDF